jgi:hypothetical protein
MSQKLRPTDRGDRDRRRERQYAKCFRWRTERSFGKLTLTLEGRSVGVRGHQLSQKAVDRETRRKTTD